MARSGNPPGSVGGVLGRWAPQVRGVGETGVLWGQFGTRRGGPIWHRPLQLEEWGKRHTEREGVCRTHNVGKRPENRERGAFPGHQVRPGHLLNCTSLCTPCGRPGEGGTRVLLVVTERIAV